MTAALLILVSVIAVVMLLWNLFLMRLLDIAKGDVHRLSLLLHPSQQLRLTKDVR